MLSDILKSSFIPSTAVDFGPAFTQLAGSAGGGTLSLPNPGGIVEGDLMVVFWSVYASNAALLTSVPSGWTEHISTSATTGGVVHSIAMYSKVATASEPSSYSFGRPSISSGAYVMTGVVFNNATGIDVISSLTRVSGSTSISIPGITPTETGREIVVVTARQTTNLSSSFISGFTSLRSAGTSVNNGSALYCGRRNPIRASHKDIFTGTTLTNPVSASTTLTAFRFQVY